MRRAVGTSRRSWAINYKAYWDTNCFSFQSACRSESNALFFHGSKSDRDVNQFATTQELNLYIPASDIILEEHIDGDRLPLK